MSAIELCSILDVNYKTALLLESNCRILMSLSNSDKLLNSNVIKLIMLEFKSDDISADILF